MRKVTTIVIGAGHCGLAMSRCLNERAIDHVVLERGAIGEAWRTERWDSLRLLTPNWLSRLPGDAYAGPDPDGFMDMPELIARLERYAARIGAPVESETEVIELSDIGGGFRVITSRGAFCARHVVLATGACRRAAVPEADSALPPAIASFDALTYKRPDALPNGAALVVGASATGVQIAKEVRASGRAVTLAVGEHVRAPRRYRGRDIKWWLDRVGFLDLRHDEVDDLRRVRRTPSFQLAGSDDHQDLDLNTLTATGVELVGRFAGLRDGRAAFSGSLANHCAAADLKLTRLLDAIDTWIAEQGLGGAYPPTPRPAPTWLPAKPRLEIDLRDGAFGSVIWATGYRPDWSWLQLPVFDRRGRLQHDGGIIAPGLYAMGLPFMRRRKSTLIDGAGADARDLVEHMSSQLAKRAA